jgi:methionine-rich copper-binding protein CopC
MSFKYPRVRLSLIAAATTLLALTIPFVPTASAHAPIEWSDPKSDAVVTELPKTVKVRFAEEPVSVTMRSIEPEPREGIALNPIRISERTYEVALPASMITPTDNTVVIFIEVRSKDGHVAGGVYLLHVVDKATTTTTSTTSSPPIQAIDATDPVITTPPAVFMPPTNTGSASTPIWLIGVLLVTSGTALVTVLHRARKRN